MAKMSTNNKALAARASVIALGVLGLAAAIAVGAILRLDDPLSTRVIPAEDPYTHMALVRQHLADGDLDPLNAKGNLYPPGLHAFLGAAWTYTGADLYEIVRIGPAVLGAVGILGIGLLLWRFEGPLAAFVGAMALAVAPEAIFRTTMMSPTALDLALVPFFLYSLIAVVTGRLGWVGVAVPMAAFLVFAHPWLFLVITLAATLYALLALAMPWASSRGRTMTPMGFAAAAAIVGGALALTGATSPGFRTTLNVPDAIPFDILLVVFATLSFVPLGLLAVWPRSLDRVLPAQPRRMPLWVRIGVSVALAMALLLVTLPALRRGMPEFVDLPRMFGWPILGLAALALIALPFVRGPLATLAAAWAIGTYPFVIYNPLQSEFWPHRTAAFMGIGLVLLVGVAAALLARLGHALMTRLARTDTPSSHNGLRRAVTTLIPAALVVILVGGGVYGATPVSYPGGWYRLYNECELGALEEVAASIDADPDAIVITGTWQPRVVVAALTEDASRVWFKPEFFHDPDHRERFLVHAEKHDIPVLVIVDRHMILERGHLDTGFLDNAPFERAGTYCEGMGIAQPRLTTHRLMETAA